MNKYNSQLEEQLNVEIGTTKTELDVMKATQRKGETKIGNLIADVMKDYTNADVALVNGGGIRAERIFPVGPLTKRDIMDALPFTNFVVKLELTGEQIYQALENAVSGVENGAGRFAQVSGIEYSFNPEQLAGSRIISVKINGKALDQNATYTLATVDSVANGGDGYESFKDAKVLLDANAGPLLSTLVIDTIKEKGTISPKIEGRIQIVTEQQQKEKESKEDKSSQQNEKVKNAEPKTATIYVVKKGDTLSHIGLEYGISWEELAKFNQLKNPHLILIGQKIGIPSKK
jgi:2',3'-cyclic-nucleotide 2'-phosphodiesterase (5'-nucleotidase family)